MAASFHFSSHISKLLFIGLTALCERPAPRIYEGGEANLNL